MLRAQILETETRIDNYDARPTEDSCNSSKPPSLDSLPKSAPKSLRHTEQRPRKGIRGETHRLEFAVEIFLLNTFSRGET